MLSIIGCTHFYHQLMDLTLWPEELTVKSRDHLEDMYTYIYICEKNN
jgi:hypothetical protein